MNVDKVFLAIPVGYSCGHLARGRRDLNWSQHWPSPSDWAGLGRCAERCRGQPIQAVTRPRQHRRAGAGITSGLCHRWWCLGAGSGCLMTVWCLTLLYGWWHDSHNVILNILSRNMSSSGIFMRLFIFDNIQTGFWELSTFTNKRKHLSICIVVNATSEISFSVLPHWGCTGCCQPMRGLLWSQPPMRGRAVPSPLPSSTPPTQPTLAAAGQTSSTVHIDVGLS